LKALDSFGATGTLLIAAAAATVIGALVDELCELLIEGPVRSYLGSERLGMRDVRPPDEESLVGRDISDFEQRELEREDARSDRAFSEVKLRLGLAPALVGLALVLPADTNVSIGTALAMGAIGLLFGASGVRRTPDYINRSAQARATRRELQSRGVRRPGVAARPRREAAESPFDPAEVPFEAAAEAPAQAEAPAFESSRVSRRSPKR
jgi:hypothetical protein